MTHYGTLLGLCVLAVDDVNRSLPRRAPGRLGTLLFVLVEQDIESRRWKLVLGLDAVFAA